MPDSQAFAVSNLRGMDERWSASPNMATRIRDMTWDDRDGWKDSGGYKIIAKGSAGLASEDVANPFIGEGTITSLHWFAQHNGARQWMVWETSGGALRYFNGSLSRTSDPWTGVPDVGGTAITNRTNFDVPWIRTQSQAWGGRLYLINGYDAPLVFDGTKVEQAGFLVAPDPPQPLALDGVASDGMHTTIFVEGGSLGSGTAFAYRPLEIMGLGAQNDGVKADVDQLDGDPNARKCAYKYVVTYLNERGQESPPSPPSPLCQFENGSRLYSTAGKVFFSAVHESGKTFVNVEIPVGGNEVVARRIYRTRNVLDSSGDGVELEHGHFYYFLMEIPDNVTTTVEDGIPDSMLGPVLDPESLGPWPTGAKLMASFKNTMFVAGHSSNELAYSRPLFPEVFPVDNVFHIGDKDMGPITGLYPTKNALVVFKRHGIYLIKGNPSDGFQSQTLNRDYGCIAPNTLRELPGLGLAFLSQRGVALLQGALENTGSITKVVELSMSIPDQIERINWSAAIQSMGEVYHRDREYWVAVPIIGSDKNNLVLVYHYEVGAWSYRDSFPIGCMRETGDHRGYLFFGSNDTANNNEGIWNYSRGADNKNGTAVSPLYESATIDFGSLYRNIAPVHVMAYCAMYGNNDLQLDYRLNRSTRLHRSRLGDGVQAADQQDPNNRMSVYDTGVWGPNAAGAARWGHHEPTRVRFDVSGARGGPVFELQVVFTPASRRMQLVGYDIEASVGEKRKIKPLNESLGPSTR